MTTSCARVAILAIVLLVGSSTTGLAHPSDWADVVETQPTRAKTTSKAATASTKTKTKTRAKKPARAGKRVASSKAKKAKARTTSKRRR